MHKDIEEIDFKSLLKKVCKIAAKAGESIVDIYLQTSFEVNNKPDSSPVTEADMMAHHVIKKHLRHISNFPVLSEESKAISFEERKNWTTYWLIDPLDGTREFIKRNDEFSVNIALIHQGKAILGVIYAPVTEMLYAAANGLGAYRREPMQNFQRIKSRLKPRKPDVFGSRSHQSKKLYDFLQKVDNYNLIKMGSSLKSCMIAEGKADLYLRFGPTGEWDTAASQCILEESGACIVDLDLKPLVYNQKESLINPEFLVCDKRALDEWAKYLASA